MIANSCNDLSKTKNTHQVKLKIETYLDSIPKNYEGHKENSVIEEEMNTFLKSDFPKQFNDGLLDDLPLILDRVEKCDNMYIVNLEHSLTSKYYKHGVLSDFDIEIYGETDEQTAKSLIEKKSLFNKRNF